MRVEPAIQNPQQELQKSAQVQPVSGAENQPNSETHIGNVTSFDSPSVSANTPATMEGHTSSASEAPADLFDREAVMKFINDSGLLSYNVRSLRINNYLKSLYKMAHLLTMSRLRREAIREVQSEIADMIHTYVQDPAYKDNLGKAKGFAEYARQNPGVGRIQLIRMSEDAAKNKRFKRLDMSKSAIRDKVSHATSNDELDHIFDTDGFFADLIED